MKLVLVVFLLIAIVMAQKKPEPKEVAEVRDETKQFPGTTLVILYDAGADQKRTEDMIKKTQQSILKEKGAETYKFFLTEVPVDALKQDAADRKLDPEKFLDELQIEDISLKHAPTLVVIRKGWAFWAHGDGAVESVKKELKSFDAKARASNPHAMKEKDQAEAQLASQSRRRALRKLAKGF